MKDIPEFYILGLPIETEIGLVDFIKVKEYPDYYQELHLFSMSKEELIYRLSEVNKNGSLNELIELIKPLSLFQISTMLPDLANAYYKIFTRVFNSEDSLSKINESNFDYYRKLIMRMNVLKEEKINPNPEIQRAIERSKRLKAAEGDRITFADIVSSVVGYNGLSYKDINEFTLYQLYMTYYRIANIKNYDTSTLFATVSAEKINIESWSKHIDLFEEEQHAFTVEQFDKKVKSVFK